MGGTSGVPTADPANATGNAATASPMAVAPPTGAQDTGIIPGTPGSPGVDYSKLPAWAEGLDKASVQSIFNSLGTTGTTTPTPNTTPTENLGFPAAEPPGFQHAPLPQAAPEVGHLGAPAPAPPTATPPTATPPAEDPNARVAVYIPAGGFGFGTAGGTFGSTSQNTYQQQAGPNGSTQAISNPYGISVEGVNSGNDSWQQRGAQELGWLDPASYQQNTTYLQSGLQPQKMSYKPGDVVPAGTANVPTMSKALYDFNMKAYGNPYGAGYTQQYIGGPAQTPVGEYPGYGGGG
jgi:hypothetical protein